jgi:hypothetical protein
MVAVLVQMAQKQEKLPADLINYGPGPEAAAFYLCAEHATQLGGKSPIPNLMEVYG